jgi:tetratricopeptide (TPR) repeat protein
VNSPSAANQAAAAAVQKPVKPPATGNTSSASSSQLKRQGAAQETLAHAQSLWAAGSHEQALELMREAVAVAERAYNAGTLPADSPVLASLVRELARMELAEGRVGRVLELLTRLEPALSRQADLWAVRGNAAQRLARHQEAVQAYLKALELRSDEPRWMLGAAVSLAALGRLDAAAEQVERARSLGAVSPEILAYLRQAGVPLK